MAHSITQNGPCLFWQWTGCNSNLILSARNGTQQGAVLFRTQGLENSRKATGPMQILPTIRCTASVAPRLVFGTCPIRIPNAAPAFHELFDCFPHSFILSDTFRKKSHFCRVTCQVLRWHKITSFSCGSTVL
jgi:hypothetical protein